MRTVQMTLEEDLVARVDRAARKLRTSRSGFARVALRQALERLAVLEQERRHRKGYEARPVRRGEFDAWAGEQAWPE
jgi:metal-responsive CopG/Arc/MetJ family transcriptional regulator